MHLTPRQFLALIKTAPLVAIDLVIRNQHGDVLLGRRTNRPAKGFWFVPGGRIRRGETIKAAIHRITKNELGTTLPAPLLLGAFDHFYPDNAQGVPGLDTHYVSLAYTCEWAGPFGESDGQHSDFQWMTVKELLAHKKVHPNTKAFFK